MGSFDAAEFTAEKSGQLGGHIIYRSLPGHRQSGQTHRSNRPWIWRSQASARSYSGLRTQRSVHSPRIHLERREVVEAKWATIRRRFLGVIRQQPIVRPTLFATHRNPIELDGRTLGQPEKPSEGTAAVLLNPSWRLLICERHGAAMLLDQYDK